MQDRPVSSIEMLKYEAARLFLASAELKLRQRIASLNANLPKGKSKSFSDAETIFSTDKIAYGEEKKPLLVVKAIQRAWEDRYRSYVEAEIDSAENLQHYHKDDPIPTEVESIVNRAMTQMINDFIYPPEKLIKVPVTKANLARRSERIFRDHSKEL